MNPSSYASPHRGQIRALERNIMKYRSMQMTLVIHYAQELRRIVIDTVQAADHLRASHDPEYSERIPSGSKSPFQKAIKVWVADGMLALDEAEEIKKLTDFRNDIAHRMHLLAADLSQHRFVRDAIRFDTGRMPKHDFGAAERMKSFIELLYDRISMHGTIVVASPNALFFETAEKALKQELSSLGRKINRLYREREAEIEGLKSELEAMRRDFPEADFPGHPLDTYDNGRLTPRGVEQVYQLFDRNYSPLAVAHVMRLSIRAARKRLLMWKSEGGRNRQSVDIHQLPWRKFFATTDD